MESTKRQKLEAAGWKVGSVTEFLQLSPKEAAIIETRLALRKYPTNQPRGTGNPTPSSLIQCPECTQNINFGDESNSANNLPPTLALGNLRPRF
jgi:hypothetical protein